MNTMSEFDDADGLIKKPLTYNSVGVGAEYTAFAQFPRRDSLRAWCTHAQHVLSKRVCDKNHGGLLFVSTFELRDFSTVACLNARCHSLSCSSRLRHGRWLRSEHLERVGRASARGLYVELH